MTKRRDDMAKQKQTLNGSSELLAKAMNKVFDETVGGKPPESKTQKDHLPPPEMPKEVSAASS